MEYLKEKLNELETVRIISETYPRVVTGEKNSPTVAHAWRKRRLKWVLPQVGGWSTGLATLSL
jgi:hypothetical protein